VDVLELRFEPASFSTGADRQVVPYVNGTSLLTLSLPVRRTKAGPKRRSDRHVRLADGHAGLAVIDGTAPDLADLAPRREPHEAAVLGCECGDTGCSPVMATIRGDASTVTWSLGSRAFRFSRDQYERALAAADRHGPQPLPDARG
jgi:hypothetical protein